MFFQSRKTQFRTALAIFTALNLTAQISGYGAWAAVAQNPTNSTADNPNVQLAKADAELKDWQNRPYNFCDPVAVSDREKALWHILDERHHAKVALGQGQTVMQAAQTAANDLKKAGYAEHSAAMDNYEASAARGDSTVAANLMTKLTPLEQAHEAEVQHKYSIAQNLLVPLADKGSVEAQQRVGFLEELDWDKGVLPPGGTPHDGALALKYFHMAAAKGDDNSQDWVATAYACGLGAKKDLVKAYEWFSVPLAQPALLRSDRVWEITSKRDFIAAS